MRFIYSILVDVFHDWSGPLSPAKVWGCLDTSTKRQKKKKKALKVVERKPLYFLRFCVSPQNSSTFQASRTVEQNHLVREANAPFAPLTVMPAGCWCLSQAEQRTTRTRSLWLKRTNPSSCTSLSPHRPRCHSSWLLHLPAFYLHVLSAGFCLPLNFHLPFPPHTAHLFLLNQ